MKYVILFPVIVESGKLDKLHQNHEPYVGLKLLNSDLGPASKLFGSHALKSELVTLLEDVSQKSWGEEAAYRGGKDWHFGTSYDSERWDIDCFK